MFQVILSLILQTIHIIYPRTDSNGIIIPFHIKLIMLKSEWQFSIERTSCASLKFSQQFAGMLLPVLWLLPSNVSKDQIISIFRYSSPTRMA